LPTQILPFSDTDAMTVHFNFIFFSFYCHYFSLLSAPRVRTTFVSRGFSVAAPAVWNSLPSGIRDSSSTHTFRRLLKNSLLPAGLRLPLATHPSASDSTTG